MGMAASQGRLLFMTARLSNNEFEQQSVAYSKQRLAEASQTANDQYLEALQATTYQVLTGYNGSEATFENVTYNQLTGFNNVATGKQYIVQDTNGRILVDSKIAKAFENGNGDYNKFLQALGLTQVNIDVTDKTSAQKAIHEAWDKYLVSVGRGINSSKTSTGSDAALFGDSRHILGFGYQTLGQEEVLGGYPLYKTAFAKSFAGKTYDVSKNENGKYYTNNYPVRIEENPYNAGSYIVVYNDATGKKCILDDYTVKANGDDPTKYNSFVDKNGKEHDLDKENIYVRPFTITNKEENKEVSYEPTITTETDTELDASIFNVTVNEMALNFEGTTAAQRRLYDYAVAITEAFYNQGADHSAYKYDAAQMSYYQNIYDQMITNGYTTYEKMKETKYISSTANENEALKDDNWLIHQIQTGKLTISYFSAVEKDFIKSSLDDDESITEKEDKSKIAIAEQVYKTEMDKIESQDKYFDMQLNKLESEHSALQTEYESVAKVISKNVEKSFNTFNA